MLSRYRSDIVSIGSDATAIRTVKADAPVGTRDARAVVSDARIVSGRVPPVSRRKRAIHGSRFVNHAEHRAVNDGCGLESVDAGGVSWHGGVKDGAHRVN